MSGAPVEKLPASPRVSSTSVPVADRGGEEVNVGFSDLRTGGSNQLRDPRLRRSAGNDREFSLGNEFHMGPLPYHIKEVMCYTPDRKRELFCLVCKLSGVLFCTLFGVMRRANICPSRLQSRSGPGL